MSMKRNNIMRIWAFPIMFLLLSTAVLADYSCVNETHSLYETTLTISGTDIPISYPELCDFGCYNVTGECNPNPYSPDNFVFVLLLPIISFILLYISTILKAEDWAIHLLLLIGALLFLVVPLGMLNNVLTGPYNGLYMALTVIVGIVIFYYVLKVLVGAINMMRGSKGG